MGVIGVGKGSKLETPGPGFYDRFEQPNFGHENLQVQGLTGNAAFKTINREVRSYVPA